MIRSTSIGVLVLLAAVSEARAEGPTTTQPSALRSADALDEEADGYRNAGIVLVSLGVAGVIGGRVLAAQAKSEGGKSSSGFWEGPSTKGVLSIAATGTGVLLGVTSAFYFVRSGRLRGEASAIRGAHMSTVVPTDGGLMAQFSGSF